MRRLVGIDEAGRGALAGPVVAAAVIFPTARKHPKIKDSKQMRVKIVCIRPVLFESRRMRGR